MHPDAPSVNIFMLRRNCDTFRINRAEFLVPVLEASNPSWVLVRFKDITEDTTFFSRTVTFPRKGLVLKSDPAREMWRELLRAGWMPDDRNPKCSRVMLQADLPLNLTFESLKVLEPWESRGYGLTDRPPFAKLQA